MTEPLDRLREIAIAFQHSKVLLAAARLRVFDRLRGDGASATAVAAGLGVGTRGVEILLDALASLDLVEKRAGIYRNRSDFEPFLVEDGPTHFAASLRHSNRLFRHWAFLEERVLGAAIPPGLDEHTALEDHEDFIRAMYAITHRQAQSIVARVPLGTARTVADLGGGPGHYLAEFLHRSSSIEGYLVDLPASLAVARRLQRDDPDWARARLVAWDLYAEEAPASLPPIDLAFLSQVVHSESAEANRRLLRRLFRVVSPGGRVVVHERTVDDDRTSPREAAIFAVNMLAMTAAGRTYTAGEIVEWGAEAGFNGEPGERVSERSYLVSLRKPAADAQTS